MAGAAELRPPSCRTSQPRLFRSRARRSRSAVRRCAGRPHVRREADHHGRPRTVPARRGISRTSEAVAAPSPVIQIRLPSIRPLTRLSMPRTALVGAIAAVLTTAACANTATQTAASQVAASEASTAAASTGHRGAFVVKLGSDTIIVERFSRTDSAYSVEQAARSPQTRLYHTHIEMTPADELKSIHYMQHRIGGTMNDPLIASTQVTITGDSATLLGKRGDSTDVNRRVAAPRGAIPTLPSSYFGFELASMRLVAAGRDSMPARLLGPNGPISYAAKRVGRDSVFFIFELDPATIYRAHIDAQGRLLHMHAPFTTFK